VLVTLWMFRTFVRTMQNDGCTLTPCQLRVLAGLLACDGHEAYGYTLIKAGFNQTTVYRALKCAERAGLVSTRWVSTATGQPDRRMYRIVPSRVGEVRAMTDLSRSEIA
jgi:DNA-binding PadR family transcriptional regulator